MHIGDKAAVLRIYIGESHYYKQMPVYEDILYRARERRLAGATVQRSWLGFGKTELQPEKHLHEFRISDDVPVIVEIVDTEERVLNFLAEVRMLLGSRGLVTLGHVQVMHYGNSYSPDVSPPA